MHFHQDFFTHAHFHVFCLHKHAHFWCSLCRNIVQVKNSMVWCVWSAPALRAQKEPDLHIFNYYQWESSRSFQLMFPDTFTAAAQKHQNTVTYSVGLSLLATSWTLKPWSSLWTVPGVPNFAHCHAKSTEKRFVYVQSARRGQKTPQCLSCIGSYTICAQRAFAHEGPGLMTCGESRPQVLPWSYKFKKRVTAAESIGRAL